MEAGPSTARPRARLTKDGSAYLTNYACAVSSYPQRAEKERILASLRAIPGNEAFTLNKLSSWFARHRNISRPPAHQDEEAILFPKLTPTHFQQLKLLYRKRPDPTEGIISFWANRISADKDDVAGWIEYQQEKAKDDDRVGATPESPDVPLKRLVGDCDSESVSTTTSPTSPEFPRPHLPTPAKSLSPHTRMPSLPPITVKLEDQRQWPSPLSSLSTPSLPSATSAPWEPRGALDGLPPLTRLQTRLPVALPTTTQRTDGRHWRDSRTTLAAAIRDSLRPSAAPSGPLPRTADEFAAQFEATEKMIDAFLKKHENGQLARLGWDPSEAPLYCGARERF